MNATGTTKTYNKKVELDELDEQTARLMGFKKVLLFMGKWCVQIDGDVSNNNIPWSPTRNANDAMQILNKYRLSLEAIGDLWFVGTNNTITISDSNPLIAICKSLIAHAKLG